MNARLVVLATILLLALLPTASAYADAPVPAACAEIIHHDLSRYAIEGLKSGKAQIWKSGQVIVAAIPVAECGGAILFAKWRGSQLITNFFPSEKAASLWAQKAAANAYIARNVVGYTKVAAGVAMKMIFSPAIILVNPNELCRRDRNYCQPVKN